MRVNFVGLGRLALVCGAELRTLIQERQSEYDGSEAPAKSSLKIGSVTIKPEQITQFLKIAATIMFFYQ